MQFSLRISFVFNLKLVYFSLANFNVAKVYVLLKFYFRFLFESVNFNTDLHLVLIENREWIVYLFCFIKSLKIYVQLYKQSSGNGISVFKFAFEVPAGRLVDF